MKIRNAIPWALKCGCDYKGRNLRVRPIPTNAIAAPSGAHFVRQVWPNCVSISQGPAHQWLLETADETPVRVPDKVGPVSPAGHRAKHDPPRTGNIVGSNQTLKTIERYGRADREV